VDPATDTDIEHAQQLQITDQSAVGELWAKIDRAMVDRAAVAPIFNPQAIHFLSKRVGNHQHHPLFGLLISQLWVR
jgi:hypothetical protein